MNILPSNIMNPTSPPVSPTRSIIGSNSSSGSPSRINKEEEEEEEEHHHHDNHNDHNNNDLIIMNEGNDYDLFMNNIQQQQQQQQQYQKQYQKQRPQNLKLQLSSISIDDDDNSDDDDDEEEEEEEEEQYDDEEEEEYNIDSDNNNHDQLENIFTFDSPTPTNGSKSTSTIKKCIDDNETDQSELAKVKNELGNNNEVGDEDTLKESNKSDHGQTNNEDDVFNLNVISRRDKSSHSNSNSTDEFRIDNANSNNMVENVDNQTSLFQEMIYQSENMVETNNSVVLDSNKEQQRTQLEKEIKNQDHHLPFTPPQAFTKHVVMNSPFQPMEQHQHQQQLYSQPHHHHEEQSIQHQLPMIPSLPHNMILGNHNQMSHGSLSQVSQQPSRRSMKLRLQEEQRILERSPSSSKDVVGGGGNKVATPMASSILDRFRPKAHSFGNDSDQMTMMGKLYPNGTTIIDRGTISVSWYAGTSTFELQEHVKKSVERKLGVGAKKVLRNFRVLDINVEPNEGELSIIFYFAIDPKMFYNT